MTIYFSWPSKIDGFLPWLYHSWQIHTPTSYKRYKTEHGVRYFGVTFTSVERNKHGTVI